MSKEIRVGLFFAISLVILATTVFYVGNFQENVKYQIRFFRVDGLEANSPVHFNGVPIGRVSKIVLEEQTETNINVSVIVTIAVHRSVRTHIRTSTLADIKSKGVLGDKYILMATPDYQAPQLAEGAFIKAVVKTLNVDKLLRQGTDLVSDVTDMTENLKLLLSQLAKNDGVLQRLIRDPELAASLADGLKRILDEIENKESIAGVLLNDPVAGASFRKELGDAMKGLATLAEDLQRNDNAMALLTRDPEFSAEIRERATTLLKDMQEFVTATTQSQGLLYRLTQDKEYGDRVAADIEKITHHLASILEKVDEGDGTASLIVNDPALYQGIYQVVYGLEHSGLSKWYIQRKRKKGDSLLQDENEEGDVE